MTDGNDLERVALGVAATFFVAIVFFTFRAVSAKLLIFLLRQESVSLKSLVEDSLRERLREADNKLDEALRMGRDAAAASTEALANTENLEEAMAKVQDTLSDMGLAIGSMPDVTKVIDKFERTLSQWTEKIETVVTTVARVDERQKMMQEQQRILIKERH